MPFITDQECIKTTGLNMETLLSYVDEDYVVKDRNGVPIPKMTVRYTDEDVKQMIKDGKTRFANFLNPELVAEHYRTKYPYRDDFGNPKPTGC